MTRFVLALALVMLAAPGEARRREPILKDELALDMAAPVIAVVVAGVPLRLRVDLDQRDVVELNPEAAARLPVAWEAGFDAQVGRVALSGRQARATLLIDGTTMEIAVAEHGRPCCADADGAISPALLPYRLVRFRRAGVVATGERRWPVLADPDSGLQVEEPVGGEQLRLRFSLAAPRTTATGAAGAVLARQGGGRFPGPTETLAGPFGVPRPVRLLRLARPVRLAGFAVAGLPVRVTDFRGREPLPTQAAAGGDIRVTGRAPPIQAPWRAVEIGSDRLSACAEILWQREPATLTLSCAW